MNKELQRIAIAEACGWRLHGRIGEKLLMWPPLHGDATSPPDYLNDLNAIHSAILQLVTSKLQRVAFSEHLTAILNRSHDGEHRFIGASPFHHATAEAGELCEALLNNLGLWTPTGEENE